MRSMYQIMSHVEARIRQQLEGYWGRSVEDSTTADGPAFQSSEGAH